MNELYIYSSPKGFNSLINFQWLWKALECIAEIYLTVCVCFTRVLNDINSIHDQFFCSNFVVLCF